MTNGSTPSGPTPVTATPAPSVVQPLLFTRRAIAEYPVKKRTADALGEAEADDQQRYYLKADSAGKPVRASEWICTGLAELVGIAAPAPAVIERMNGDVVFGSRRIVGVSDEVTTANYLRSSTVSNTGSAVLGLRELLSAIYAFDMFVFNEDRHLGNYLSVDDAGVRRFYAYDFSRALFWRWPWTDFPKVPDKTVLWGRALRSLHGFDEGAATGILDRLGSVPIDALEGVLKGMPSDWLEPTLRSELLGWWSGHTRQDRLDQIREGFKDGSLL